MLFIVDCKYQLIKDNRVFIKFYDRDDIEVREDGFVIKVKGREEVMNLLDDDELEVDKGYKVFVIFIFKILVV